MNEEVCLKGKLKVNQFCACGKCIAERLKKVIQPSTESLINNARRAGAKQELEALEKEIKKRSLEYTLTDIYFLNHIEKRLKDLANEGVCMSQKPKVFEELEK